MDEPTPDPTPAQLREAADYLVDREGPSDPVVAWLIREADAAEHAPALADSPMFAGLTADGCRAAASAVRAQLRTMGDADKVAVADFLDGLANALSLAGPDQAEAWRRVGNVLGAIATAAMAALGQVWKAYVATVGDDVDEPEARMVPISLAELLTQTADVVAMLDGATLRDGGTYEAGGLPKALRSAAAVEAEQEVAG